MKFRRSVFVSLFVLIAILFSSLSFSQTTKIEGDYYSSDSKDETITIMKTSENEYRVTTSSGKWRGFIFGTQNQGGYYKNVFLTDNGDIGFQHIGVRDFGLKVLRRWLLEKDGSDKPWEYKWLRAK